MFKEQLEVSAPCPTCKHPSTWIYEHNGLSSQVVDVDCKRCEFDNDGSWT